MVAEFFIALGFALYSGTDSAFVYDTLKQVKKEIEKLNKAKVYLLGQIKNPKNKFKKDLLEDELDVLNAMLDEKKVRII